MLPQSVENDPAAHKSRKTDFLAEDAILSKTLDFPWEPRKSATSGADFREGIIMRSVDIKNSNKPTTRSYSHYPQTYQHERSRCAATAAKIIEDFFQKPKAIFRFRPDLTQVYINNEYGRSADDFRPKETFRAYRYFREKKAPLG